MQCISRAQVVEMSYYGVVKTVEDSLVLITVLNANSKDHKKGDI